MQALAWRFKAHLLSSMMRTRLPNGKGTFSRCSVQGHPPNLLPTTPPTTAHTDPPNASVTMFRGTSSAARVLATNSKKVRLWVVVLRSFRTQGSDALDRATGGRRTQMRAAVSMSRLVHAAISLLHYVPCLSVCVYACMTKEETPCVCVTCRFVATSSPPTFHPRLARLSVPVHANHLKASTT